MNILQVSEFFRCNTYSTDRRRKDNVYKVSRSRPCLHTAGHTLQTQIAKSVHFPTCSNSSVVKCCASVVEFLLEMEFKSWPSQKTFFFKPRKMIRYFTKKEFLQWESNHQHFGSRFYASSTLSTEPPGIVEICSKICLSRSCSYIKHYITILYGICIQQQTMQQYVYIYALMVAPETPYTHYPFLYGHYCKCP